MSYLAGNCPKHGKQFGYGASGPCPVCQYYTSQKGGADVVPWTLRQVCSKHGAFFRGEREPDHCPECVRELRAWKRENLGRMNKRIRSVYRDGGWHDENCCVKHGAWHPVNEECPACWERAMQKARERAEYGEAVQDLQLMRAVLGAEGYMVKLGKNEVGAFETVKVPEEIQRGVALYYAVKEVWMRGRREVGHYPGVLYVSNLGAKRIYDALVYNGYPERSKQDLDAIARGDLDWYLLMKDDEDGTELPVKLLVVPGHADNEVTMPAAAARVRMAIDERRPANDPRGDERTEAARRHEDSIRQEHGEGAAKRFRQMMSRLMGE